MYGSNISATYKRNTIIGTKNPLDEILLIENFNNNNNYSSRTLYCKPSDM